MWIMNTLDGNSGDRLKALFMDKVAYEKAIGDMAIIASSRMARGGIALQEGDVISESEFQEEMNRLKEKVESAPAV